MEVKSNKIKIKEGITFPQFSSKFILNDFQGILHKHGQTIENCNIPPEVAGNLCRLIYDKQITRAMAREFIDTILSLKEIK